MVYFLFGILAAIYLVYWADMGIELYYLVDNVLFFMFYFFIMFFALSLYDEDFFDGANSLFILFTVATLISLCEILYPDEAIGIMPSKKDTLNPLSNTAYCVITKRKKKILSVSFLSIMYFGFILFYLNFQIKIFALCKALACFDLFYYFYLFCFYLKAKHKKVEMKFAYIDPFTIVYQEILKNRRKKKGEGEK